MTAKPKGDLTKTFDAIKRPAPVVKSKEDKGLSKMTFELSTPAKKQLAIMAVDTEKTQRELLAEALNLLFREHKKPEIA
ncbi:MAG: hypothetical protein F9K49_00135 [Caedimonadaceae bacterium]|nr:MAG: hypothetical protein F9K49_00135 [Caedimonadaceae bacterium]